MQSLKNYLVEFKKYWIPATIVLGLIASVIQIGGCNMQIFWNNLFETPFAVPIIDTVLALIAIGWGLVQKKKRDKAVASALTAEGELIKEKDKGSAAIDLVYVEKDKEIEKLKTDKKRACVDAEQKVIAAKDDAEKRINAVNVLAYKRINAAVALADKNANEAAKWENNCRICFDEYQRETQELSQKSQSTQNELERYQNAPPGAIQHQRTIGIKANVAKPKNAAFLKVVKELENKNKSNH